MGTHERPSAQPVTDAVPRILHAPTEVGGQAFGLLRAERELGLHSDVAVLAAGLYGYGADIRIELDGTRRSEPAHADGHAPSGHDGEVVVVHAPNHRHIKGTDRLIEVVEQLRGEGLGVRLELLEKRPNSEVRTAVQAGDIVAERSRHT